MGGAQDICLISNIRYGHPGEYSFKFIIITGLIQVPYEQPIPAWGPSYRVADPNRDSQKYFLSAFGLGIGNVNIDSALNSWI